MMHRLMRWIAVVAWMGVIFFFSSQTGGESAGLSDRIVDAFAAVVPLDPAFLGLLVRKGAHVGEYAILGALLAWALQSSSLRRAAIAVAIGVAYAATDEVHQLFVPGRAGQVSDVLIDAVGVALGVGAILFLRSRRSGASHARRHRDRHRQRATLPEKSGSSG